MTSDQARSWGMIATDRRARQRGHRTFLTLVLGPWSLVLALAGARLDGPPTPGQWPEGLRKGMTPDEVRAVLGAPPRRITRQILSHRSIEQWICDQPRPLRLEFDCPRGQKPQLQAVRPLESRSPRP